QTVRPGSEHSVLPPRPVVQRNHTLGCRQTLRSFEEPMHLMRPLLSMFALWAFGSSAIAEVSHIRLARQLGLGYLQFYVMQERRLVEKPARELGLGTVTTEWAGLGTPTALTDVLLTGSVDIVGLGLPGFLTMWDKTRGNLNVKSMASLNR